MTAERHARRLLDETRVTVPCISPGTSCALELATGQRFNELLEDAMSLVESGFDLAESHARSGHDPIVVWFDEHVGPPVEDARISGTGLLKCQSFAPRLPTRPRSRACSGFRMAPPPRIFVRA